MGQVAMVRLRSLPMIPNTDKHSHASTFRTNNNSVFWLVKARHSKQCGKTTDKWNDNEGGHAEHDEKIKVTRNPNHDSETSFIVIRFKIFKTKTFSLLTKHIWLDVVYHWWISATNLNKSNSGGFLYILNVLQWGNVVLPPELWHCCSANLKEQRQKIKWVDLVLRK